MKRYLVLNAALLLVGFSSIAWTQQDPFSSAVKARFSKSATDRRLVDKDATLVLDDNVRKMIIRNKQQPLEVGYDDIQKVVFDVSTRMRHGTAGQKALMGFGAIGGLASAAMASKHVSHYWCYVEYKGQDGTAGSYMMEVSKELSDKLIEKMKAISGDKVTVADFPEHGENIEKNTLKDVQSKHDFKADRNSHPLPGLKADKALVVVVCPPLERASQGAGIQYKLHANDQVVAVNKMGTYSFVYLDPGDYLLASQTENASALHITLEAGKDYYFLQDTFLGGWKNDTALSRHTKELVMYELNGAYFSDWKRK